MKKYKMLKTVQGSRDGITVETFTKDETYELDAVLAEQFYHQGVVEEVEGEDDETASPNLREGGNARDRSTKVTGPEETKVTGPEEVKTATPAGEAGVPLDTQHIEELVAVARDHYGLDVDSTMSPETVKALIEKAKADRADAGEVQPATTEAQPATTEDHTADASKGKAKTTGKKSK